MIADHNRGRLHRLNITGKLTEEHLSHLPVVLLNQSNTHRGSKGRESNKDVSAHCERRADCHIVARHAGSKQEDFCAEPLLLQWEIPDLST